MVESANTSSNQPIKGEFDFSFAVFQWDIYGDNYGTALVSVHYNGQLVGMQTVDANYNVWDFAQQLGDGSTVSGTFTIYVPSGTRMGNLNLTAKVTPAGQPERDISQTLVVWDSSGNTYQLAVR
jgi:hypothetical protein